MANTKHPGFLPLGPLNGGGTVNHQRKRIISNGSAMYKGDAVVFDSSGNVLTATVTTTAVASVLMGVSYVNASNERVERHHIPASITYVGSTVDPLNSSYAYVVEDGEGTAFIGSISSAQALTNLENNYAMILTTGDTVTGYSKHELDGTTANTTNTLPWRLNEFIFKPGNDVDAADVHVKLRINAGFEPATNTTGT